MVKSLCDVLWCIIKTDRSLEEARRLLANDQDFCLRDLFNIISNPNSSKLSKKKFESFIKTQRKKFQSRDLKLIENIFENCDYDEDGLLSFQEFAQLFCPRNKNYRRRLRSKLPKYFGTNTNFDTVKKINFYFFSFFQKQQKN